MHWIRTALSSAGLAGGMFALGCGGAFHPIHEIETVPVEGTVTLDGSPVILAEVMFNPVVDDFAQRGATPQVAVGKTDDAGHFELSLHLGSASKPGALPGKYTVRLVQPLNTDGGLYDPNDKSQQIGGDGIPPKYLDPLKPTLIVEVPEEGGTVDLELDTD